MAPLLAGVVLAMLTLQDARGLAQQNIDVRVAALRVQQATEQRRFVRADWLPDVTATAQFGALWSGPQRYVSAFPVASGRYERESVDVPAYREGVFGAGVAISQLLYDGGRIWNDLGRASAKIEAEKGRLAEQRLVVNLETDRLYLEVWRAERVREALDQAVEHAADQRRRAEAQFAYGRVQRRDVIDAELNFVQDDLSRVRQKASVAGARHALREWLLLPDERFSLAPLAEGSFGQPPKIEELLREARRKRPLFAALVREREAAERGVAVARSAYLPRLSAEVAYRRQGVAADPFFTDPAKQNALQAGVALTWNLFDGFATSARVESAKLDIQEVELETRRAEWALEREIRDAFASYEASREAAPIAQKSRALAKEDLELAERRFEAGTGSTLEIRDAQIKWVRAEVSTTDAEVNLRLARSALTRAVGAL